MRHALIGLSLVVSLLSLSLPVGAVNAETKSGSVSVETVRKTCECVRRHPSGFPYIEPRIAECKTYKNGQGHVKALDCANCYAICGDKPTG